MSALYNKGINDILFYLPLRIKDVIYKLSDTQKNSLKEIRLRSDKPIVLVTQKGCSFIAESGKPSYIISDSLLKITHSELTETVKKICEYSVYSHQEDINRSFITVSGGHRVGICGNAVIENGKIISVRDICSLNFRIAGEVRGSADSIISELFYSKLSNIIISGPPMSGKTTVLRDLVRQISDGNAGEYYKCALIDERLEIAGTNPLRSRCNVGNNTDIFSSYPKKYAIEAAVRSFSPNMVFCDEVVSREESEEILNAVMSGVHFAVTVHCNSIDDLYRRTPSKILIESGLFDAVVLLSTGENVGKVRKILKLGGETNENSGFDYSFRNNLLYG